MQKRQHQQSKHEPIDISNDNQMVALGLRKPLVQRSSYDVNCKNVGLTTAQRENLPKLGLKLGPRTTERDVLRLLRKRTDFTNIFENAQIKSQSRSDKVISQYK